MLQAAAREKHAGIQRHSRLRTWHARLGHRDFTTVARALRLKCPRILPFCHQCTATKLHAAPIHEPAWPTDRPLQKLHMDLVPLPAPSLSGARYALTITDDYTGYAWLRAPSPERYSASIYRLHRYATPPGDNLLRISLRRANSESS